MAELDRNGQGFFSFGSVAVDNPEYEAFVEKFKPKKTTDDCYTPPAVYEAVLGWVVEKYGIDREKVLRPFYPEGDYEKEEYPEGWTVVDNPPFSIISKICEFYLDRDIPFFLFAPALTAFGSRFLVMRLNHIFCDADIIYENGVKIATAFVTNLGDRDIIVETAPDLAERIKEAQGVCARALPKYTYPDNVLTAAMANSLSSVPFNVRRDECGNIRKLDAQKEVGKQLYGAGLLLSDKKAAEKREAQKRAAEKLAAEGKACVVWQLSERERAIIAELGKED